MSLSASFEKPSSRGGASGVHVVSPSCVVFRTGAGGGSKPAPYGQLERQKLAVLVVEAARRKEAGHTVAELAFGADRHPAGGAPLIGSPIGDRLDERGRHAPAARGRQHVQLADLGHPDVLDARPPARAGDARRRANPAALNGYLCSTGTCASTVRARHLSRRITGHRRSPVRRAGLLRSAPERQASRTAQRGSSSAAARPACCLAAGMSKPSSAKKRRRRSLATSCAAPSACRIVSLVSVTFVGHRRGAPRSLLHNDPEHLADVGDMGDDDVVAGRHPGAVQHVLRAAVEVDTHEVGALLRRLERPACRRAR